MVDIFIIYAIIGGLSVAVMAGLLGSFMLWNKMAYFGDALSHSALLGITIGVILQLNLTIAVILISVSFALAFSYNKLRYSSDTTLGILSYSALAMAIILASYSKIKMDFMSYLFGDILAINDLDLYYLVICGFFIIIWVRRNWAKLVLLSISPELLQAERINIRWLKLKFSLVLALFIALSFQIVGILLITAMLIIPAAAALALSRSPLQMVVYAVLIGSVSVIIGIITAINLDLPTGPSIIVSSLLLFLVSNFLGGLRYMT